MGMNSIIPIGALALCGFLLPCREGRSAVAIAPLPDPVRDGQELAMKLRNAPPESGETVTGVFETITKRDDLRHVRYRSEFAITPTNWVVTYQSVATNAIPAERLIITHTPGRSNRYERWVSGTNSPIGALETPFANSDFWLIDLGLEFLHWPKQRRLGHDMRHSRSCHILESVNPNPSATGYARVMSWVDIEHGGIIRAEAFDRAGKEIKMFKVDGFERIDGRARVKSVEIRCWITGQDTKLIFDLKSQ